MSEYQFLRKHKTVEKEINGVPVLAIELLDNPYEGIIVSYGKVSFDEDHENEKLNIHFEYEMHRDNDSEYDKGEFEQYLGDLLQELIVYGIQENNIVYTGGTDDNRENNPKQSDS